MNQVIRLKRLIVFAAMIFAGLSVFGQSSETKHEWRIRLRGVGVLPQESAVIGVIGGDIKISDAFTPELDFTYFFSRHWAAELSLSTSRHELNTVHSDLEFTSRRVYNSDMSVKLGKVWLLPPTLILQYHYPVGKFNPYIGAGINYTIFYHAYEEPLIYPMTPYTNPVVRSVDYKNKFAFALQAGADYDISKRLFVNVDLKKIFLSTTASVDAGNIAIDAGLVALTEMKADVKIDPWLLGVGLGCRF